MKASTRMIIVLITLNLITAGFALAQAAETYGEEVQVSSTNVQSRPRDVAQLVRSISLSTGRRTTGTGDTVLVITALNPLK